VDKREAQEALTVADELSSRMRRKGRWHVTSVFLLGVAMLVLTLTYGLLIDSPAQSTTSVLLLIPLFVLVVYTANQSVVARYHRTLYSIITPLGAVFYTVTVVFGKVFFHDALWWWVPGAFLCAVPFFLVALLNLRAGKDAKSGP
jgi:hypothetical protein